MADSMFELFQAGVRAEVLGPLEHYMTYSLNSLKGGYIGDYIGDYYRGY